ncbi:hypothetical protein BU17DRAFT_83163 [Hysterangium stoloniferum]|nr:hypothetical protein BU17DRAFT_83163 [Hysterangium stoloniferum]
MSAAVRNNKSNPPRKTTGLQDNNLPRRIPAWRAQFPPLNPSAAPDTLLPPPSLIGTNIIVSTRAGQRFEGSLTAVPAASDAEAFLQLKDVKDLANPGAPLKDTISVSAGNLAQYISSDPLAKANGVANGSFRTDADIGATVSVRLERELQAWQPDGAVPVAPATASARGDEATFGLGSNVPNGWDQFAVNENLFGVKTSYDEEVYTTKLDRAAPDFKEREKKAQALANEIMNATSSNPHIAEERNLVVDDSGINEEDKYAGVVRGANAYVPPARRQVTPGASQTNKLSPTPSATTDIPKVSATDAIATTTSTPPAASGSNTTSPPVGSPSHQPADVTATFRSFVAGEKQRLTQKKQAIVKSEMDKRMSELVKFSQSFKLNKPMPEDLVSILAKDEEKQKQIRDKAARDAASAAARAISSANQAAPTRSPVAAASPQASQTTIKPAASKSSNAIQPGSTSTPPTATASKKDASVRIPMVIQKIPPFNPNKHRTANADKADDKKVDKAAAAAAAASDAASKLNANASPFKLKPNAPTFKPVTTAPSPKIKPAEAAVSTVTSTAPTVPSNPFFGARALKKGAPVHVKDDFNPFKAGKLPDASSVGPTWPYTGKRFMQMNPALPPPAPPQHQVPPTGPPAPPPPPYDDDQHRAYGMVYTYAPYGYAGQPMMPPGAPPGGYIPSQFLQPMHYPPIPPNGHQMYAPPPTMAPPPQQYMQASPPGPYPPPPNGAGRGSMPPTPMPPHAHAYAYHPSPQLSHAVPYQMMMPPPPPNGPPHNYDNGPPPVPMGGVGHA